MGVSEVDVQTYVNSLSGYIYAILGSFILMVAVMIAAHFIVKKGTRHVVRWSAGVGAHRGGAGQCDLLWTYVQ